MGTPVEIPDGATAEFVLGPLGYSTWNIYYEKHLVGLVILNGPNNSAFFTPFVHGKPVRRAYPLKTFSWWMRWLRENRHEPF